MVLAMAKSIISDMDGVLYRGGQLIPGANEFVQRMRDYSVPFLFLTNASEYTGSELSERLAKKGIVGIDGDHIITSAMATAMFLRSQKSRGRCYVIGGDGLRAELEAEALVLDSDHPDFVVVGKTTGFTFEMLKKATELIFRGAAFIGTNPDLVDPVEGGVEPACGALLAAIAAATGKQPYIVGKPNALMMTLATKKLGVHPDDAVMVGDRLDTDIVGGMEAGMDTCLVLSGVSSRADLDHFPYRPTHIYESVASIDPTTF